MGVTEEMMVQRDAAGGLIGKAGAKIAELREVTRCQIKIMENPEPGTDCRKVIVTGHPSSSSTQSSSSATRYRPSSRRRRSEQPGHGWPARNRAERQRSPFVYHRTDTVVR